MSLFDCARAPGLNGHIGVPRFAVGPGDEITVVTGGEADRGYRPRLAVRTSASQDGPDFGNSDAEWATGPANRDHQFDTILIWL